MSTPLRKPLQALTAHIVSVLNKAVAKGGNYYVLRN